VAAAIDAFDDVWDRLALHLRNAGRYLARPVTDVRIGEPAAVSAPLVAAWYAGDSEGILIGHTLSRANYTERVVIRWYWPVSDRTPVLTEAVEREVRRANRATTRELWGDERLGGTCAGINFLERTETGWIDLNPGWARTLTLSLGVEMPDTDDIEVTA
jgi:hypothetical protein